MNSPHVYFSRLLHRKSNGTHRFGKYTLPTNFSGPYSNDVSDESMGLPDESFLTEYVLKTTEKTASSASTEWNPITIWRQMSPEAKNATLHRIDNDHQKNLQYQHVFHICLIVIFLLQLLMVWFLLYRKGRMSRGNGNVPHAVVQFNPNGGQGPRGLTLAPPG